MKSTNLLKRLGLLGGALLVSATPAFAAVTGQWDFNGNLAATLGTAPISYNDGPGGTTATGTQFNTTTLLGIPDIGGSPATVMSFPKVTASAQGYRLPVPTTANGFVGAVDVNTWTLAMDVLFPAGSVDKARAILDIKTAVEAANANGAEAYIGADNAVTVGGASGGVLAANTWYRVVVVCDYKDLPGDGDQVVLTKYVNGTRAGDPLTINLNFPSDGAWSLNTFTGYALLFSEVWTVPTAPRSEAGYVSSIQLRDNALTPGQVAALGSPTSTKIPEQIPPVPSYVESYSPDGAYARGTTDIKFILQSGDSTLSGIQVLLNGVVQSATLVPATPAQGEQVTVTVASPGLTALTDYTAELRYNDSASGLKSFPISFRVPLAFEDFEGLALGPNVDEALAGAAVYTATPPAGWTVDHSGVYGYNNPAIGVKEFKGWTFLNKEWWATTAGDQDRTQYLRGKGTVAVADPDEWDDKGSPEGEGTMTSFLVTPTISLTGVGAGTAFLAFDSSTRSEEPQQVNITVSFDGGAPIEILRWSAIAGPTFKADAPNERIILPINNPNGASTVTIKFGMLGAENDWWWAIDNLALDAGVLPPSITTAPVLTTVTEGDNVQFTVAASGEGLSYQWYKGDVTTRQPINGKTTATLAFSPATLADDGLYSVRVSNSGGEDFSTPVRLLVLERFGGQITDELVVHLKFNGDGEDASGRNNDATPVGSPTFVPGRLGSAIGFSTTAAGGRNYVTLGAPADLNFGTSTDFTVSFWTKYSVRLSDPAFIGNKDWDSGSNQGWVLAASGNGIKWNMGYRPGFRPNEGTAVRADSASALGPLQDNNWHHVLASFNRDGVAITYVDGVQVDTVDLSTKVGQNINTPTQDRDGNPVTYRVNIGEDGTGVYNDVATGSPGFGDAKMDDLGIWRRALSADEAKAIYRAGLDGLDLSQAQAAPPVGQDLVAYLGFENNLTDGSGRNNNGTAVGTVPFVAGRVGQGVKVVTAGSSFNYVTLGRPADLDFGTTTSFTIAFWAKLNSWTDDPSFVSNKDWDSGSSVGYVLATDGDGRIQWNIAGQPNGTTTGNRRDYDSPGGIFSDLAWHHVIVAFKRLPGAGIATTYVDGVLINTTQYAGADNNVNTVVGRATNIGQDGVGAYPPALDATMDEVMIWRRALSGAEAAGVYSAGVIGLAGTQANPDLVVQLPPGAISSSVTGPSLNFQWDARSGVRLQSTPLLVPANWQDVPGTLGLENFTVPIGNADEFFRLFRP